MDDQLLVRLYNVGLGDCIYLRVPDGPGKARHILIDCGNKYASGDELRAAVADLKQQLEPNNGKLDLLVATHAHEDHIKGFEAELFDGIEIGQIWLSAAMDPEHPEAETARALHELSLKALTGLHDSRRGALSELAGDLLSLSKGEGLEALREKLPANKRLYVHAETREKHLELFSEEGTRFRVLAPMKDVDGYYLGEEFEALDDYLAFGPVFEALARGAAPTAEEGEGEEGEGEANESIAAYDPLARDAKPGAESREPENISAADFRRLKERLQSNALAFALEDGHLVNNTSVVLLLEWRGRRLLFTGDAEVKTAWGGKFREKKSNGSWNVMWEKQWEHLAKPLDFLKVGHHGSHNATPWTAKMYRERGSREEVPHPVNKILDALLPVPGEGEEPTALAVVSTERSGYPTIPSPPLMEELGKRVGNHHLYEEPAREGHFVAADVPQPQRTDLEYQVAGDPARRYVDVTFSPAGP